MDKIKLMKKLYLLLGLSLLCIQGQAQVIYGKNNYTQYHQGSLPIIISVPHGGLVDPSSIPDRTCGSPTTVTDSYTIELARQIDTALFNLTGCRPHLIICNLRRTKIDCNRNIAYGACGNLEAETAWNEFHNFIDTAQLISQNVHAGRAFYIDLHGHGKPILRLELGYGITGSELNNIDSFLNTPAQIASSSIGNLVNTNINGYTHAELLRGDFALGTLLANAGFPSVPSRQTPHPDATAYFYSGYNTNNHTCISSGNTVNGLQMECHQTVRFDYLNRKTFADSLAITLANYLQIHQNLNLMNCGSTTSINENNTLENNSINVFPNPVLDILQFPTENVNGNYEMIIINTLGEVVLKATNQKRLNVSHLTSGLYFMRLTDEQHRIWNGKMIKQ
jgi:hypothetical protein